MVAFPSLKPRHVLIAFGFGALSTLLASWGEIGLAFNAFPLLMPNSMDESTWAMILLAVVIAPFVEELAKPLGLYFIHSEEKADLELKEWAFLGAMAGLGFAVVENLMYAFGVIDFGTETSIWLLGLRFLLPLHMIASAISGYGIGLWVKTGKAKYFVACIAVSMLLHGAFNLAATLVG
ncbi:MAG: PrsW family glutamic-type intramembrane protease [Thermoplasmata archaeon]|nr:PrsW family glutamic-type intramembrane protease [Thermoplasmata archaeon]